MSNTLRKVSQHIRRAICCLWLCFSATTQGAPQSQLRFGVADPYPDDPSTSIEKRLNLYAQAGIGILRVDFGWRDIEEVEGMVHAPLRLRQLQIAVRRGFKLMVNFGSFSGPATSGCGNHESIRTQELQHAELLVPGVARHS